MKIGAYEATALLFFTVQANSTMCMMCPPSGLSVMKDKEATRLTCHDV